MNKIVLLAESGSDIPPDVAKKYNIYIIPMHVTFNNGTKDDGTFPAEDIISYYRNTGKLPKTSGCIPEDFEKIFDRIHAENPDSHILYLAYSAVTTCSYQSAVIASEERDYISLLDTKLVSGGQYVVVVQLAKWLRRSPHATLQEAIDEANILINKTRMCFYPNDLEFLKAGGRVSNIMAVCGSILKIHPRIDLEGGYLKATKKLRGNLRKMIPKLVREYTAEQDFEKEAIWMLCSPGFTEEGKKAAEEEAYACGFQKITWVKTGCVITTHGGPEAFGIVGIKNNMAVNLQSV